MKALLGILVALLVLTGVLLYLNHRREKQFLYPAWRPPVAHSTTTKHRQSRLPPVELSGPVKNRLLKKVVPHYPEWAEEQGIMGIFQAEISVTPAGEVRSHMPLLNTTCSPELDALAFNALKQWTFKRVSPTIGDQQGVVTFRFSLENPKPAALPEPCKEPDIRLNH